MGTRFSRLVSVAAAGGVLTGSLLLGGGIALAAPTVPTAPAPAPGGQVIPAACGTTVAARPSDTVQVQPLLGLPFTVPIGTAAGPFQSITQTIAGSLCQVQVQLVQPATAGVAVAAPPLAPASGAAEQGSRAVLGGPAPAAQAPAPVAAPAAAPPALAPAPVAPAPLAPAALAPSAPALAPTFGTSLPSSFPGGFAPSMPGGLAAGAPSYDASQLLGSAFPGLKSGTPGALGYDPASAVTTASQVQALPVEGSSGGMGVPVMLAVLALAGVAAFVVRALVLRRAAAAAVSAPAGDTDPTADLDAADDFSAEALTELHRPGPSSPAVGFPAVRAGEETEFLGTARR